MMLDEYYDKYKGSKVMAAKVVNPTRMELTRLKRKAGNRAADTSFLRIKEMS